MRRQPALACVFVIVFIWLVAAHGQDGGETPNGTARSSLGRCTPGTVITTGPVILEYGDLWAIGGLAVLALPEEQKVLRTLRGKHGTFVFIPENRTR